MEIKVEGWLNVDSNGASSFWGDMGIANICSSEDRIACVKIEMEVEEGEGL